MADKMLRVTTIESDEEIENFDSIEDDSYPNVNKKSKKRKEIEKSEKIFNDQFTFEHGANTDYIWSIDKKVKQSAKGRVSSNSLEEMIATKRAEKRHKKTLANTPICDSTEGIQEQELQKNPNESEMTSPNVVDSANDDINDDADDSQTEFSDHDVDDDFFEQPPPQVKHENFSKLNLSRPILRAVNELGFIHPTPIQCSTIPVALLGKDVCACAATGTGKTASYMLPILERLLFRPKQIAVSRVLVLVPTRELAIQVHSVSQSFAKYIDIQICLAAAEKPWSTDDYAMKHACNITFRDVSISKQTNVICWEYYTQVLKDILGGLKMKEQEANLRKGPDVIIATPGRLIDHLHNTLSFDIQNIEILVLDEADRMLEEHFESQMKEIIRLCQKGRQTMLFSATMTDQVEALVSLSLNRPVRIFVDQNTDVALNLQQEFVRIRPTREHDRLAIVTALCCRTFKEHCLIFCQTKKLAHTLRIILGIFGLKVGELHGDLNQLQRLEALQMFKDREIDILVATDLAARGLDISGVKTVISFNMPTTFKSYIHRVGRTARAGKFGRSITLVGEKERKNLKIAVKNAMVPVKHRIVPPEIIESYKARIKGIQKDVSDIMKQEAEERELRISEMEMNKAKNLVTYQDEIFSRPPKSWMQKESKKKEVKEKAVSLDDKKRFMEQDYLKRTMKREKKPKRMRAYVEDNDEMEKLSRKGDNKNIKFKATKKNQAGFEKELTDASKKSLKELRKKSSFDGGKKKSGNFKSKKKFKRR